MIPDKCWLIRQVLYQKLFGVEPCSLIKQEIKQSLKVPEQIDHESNTGRK